MDYFVYLMASRKNGTLYVGVTNNLVGTSTRTGWLRASRIAMGRINSSGSNRQSIL
jgi:hypothetical protein